MNVRRAAQGDAAAIAGLLGQLGYAVEPGAVRGRLERLDAEPLVARLTAVVVRDDARRRGVARALLAAAEARARAAGCEHLHVTSAEHRTDAHEAYRALGFADTGRRFGKPL